MKKYFEDCTIAVIFMSVCCGIAAIMGLIEAHDNKKGKRRPLSPTKILAYTAEWIRRVMKNVTAPFRRRRDHLVRFEDGVHRLSPEMMETIKKAPSFTEEELMNLCNPSVEITETQKILI